MIYFIVLAVTAISILIFAFSALQILNWESFPDFFIEIFQYEDILLRHINKALRTEQIFPRCPHETNPADIVDFD